MKISQIEDFLKKLREQKGDIDISFDFAWHDKEELYYDEDLNCVFGRFFDE